MDYTHLDTDDIKVAQRNTDLIDDSTGKKVIMKGKRHLADDVLIAESRNVG